MMVPEVVGDAGAHESASPPLRGHQPLRQMVLSGRFLGTMQAEASAALAAFVAAPASAEVLLGWFGADHLHRLDPEGVCCALDRDIAALDDMLGAQLDAILHHPRLQRLEGSWRGLAWLAETSDGGPRSRLKVLNASWPEICRDLERAAEFDQSQMFRKIYEEEFGHPGGEPYGLLVVDHEIRHRATTEARTDDMAALAALSGVAAAAFAPVVLAASPSLLQVDDFTELSLVPDPAAPLRGTEYARWRGLSAREDMRFVGITLPRLLARAPWADDPARVDGFRYAEHAPGTADRVWMTAGYAFASVVLRAFARHGWPADLRGVESDREGGGLVTALPTEDFATDPDAVWPRPPADLSLTDRQERALMDAGLMPLSALPHGVDAVFAAVRSLQAPRSYAGPTAEAANANARLSAQLNAILCASRFAHYIKHLGREMVGAFRDADEIQRRLQTWLQSYVNSNTSGQADSRARFPLVAGQVSVREKPGAPGVFSCTTLLQPHFQLDDVTAQFRLVTDIAATGRS